MNQDQSHPVPAPQSTQKSPLAVIAVLLMLVNILALGYLVVMNQQSQLNQMQRDQEIKSQLDDMSEDLEATKLENEKLAAAVESYEDILEEINSNSPRTVVYNYHGQGSGTNQVQPGQITENRADPVNSSTRIASNNPPAQKEPTNSPPANTQNTDTQNTSAADTNNTSTEPQDTPPARNTTTMTDEELLQKNQAKKLTPQQEQRWNEFGTQAEVYTQFVFDQKIEEMQNAFSENLRRRMKTEMLQKYVAGVIEETGGLKSFIGFQIEPEFDLTHITIATRSQKDGLYALYLSLNKRGEIESLQPVPITEEKVSDYHPWIKPVIPEEDDRPERD